MKISIAISALILAAAAGLGWQIDGRRFSEIVVARVAPDAELMVRRISRRDPTNGSCFGMNALERT